MGRRVPDALDQRVAARTVRLVRTPRLLRWTGAPLEASAAWISWMLAMSSPRSAPPMTLTRTGSRRVQRTHDMLVDWQSTRDSIVEDQMVGKRASGIVPIHDGDVIIVGTSASRNMFKFRTG